MKITITIIDREEQRETLRGLGDGEDEIDLPRLGGGPLPLSSKLIKTFKNNK